MSGRTVSILYLKVSTFEVVCVCFISLFGREKVPCDDD